MASWTVQRFTDLTMRYAVPVDRLTDKKERKARRIMEAATALFLKHGYRKTSIDEVARDAGVGKGTVYLYFDTKADLLIHCILAEKAGPGMRMLREMQSITSPIEMVRGLFRAAIDTMYELPLTARIASGDHELQIVLDDLGKEVKELIHTTRVDRIKALLAPLSQIDDPSLTKVTLGITALLQSSPEIVTQGQLLGLDRTDHSNVTADILTAGVLAVLGTDIEAIGTVDFMGFTGIRREDLDD
ncbi:MAG: TetR/AcrR family transcriptional regulator [Deltaproteobacteria bacterium]|nr:TetR/AcrR family transcriptional regulator [Deltaproteobacteria bacterium]